MFAVRYVALSALVLWLGGMMAMAIVFGAAPARFRTIALACGAVMLLCLMVMKFVGPPPRAFLLRLTILGAMLVLVAYSSIQGAESTAVSVANMGLGLVLLAWYARE